MREEKRREQRWLWDSYCPFFDRQLIVNNKFYEWGYFLSQIGLRE